MNTLNVEVIMYFKRRLYGALRTFSNIKKEIYIKRKR